MNYQKDVAAWKEDITLKSYIPDENTLQIGDYRIKMAFIREFPQTPYQRMYPAAFINRRYRMCNDTVFTYWR